MSREPTDRQLELVRLIYNYCTQHGYPPSKRELANLLSLRSTNGVSDMLLAAQKKGLLELTPFISRGISLTVLGRRSIGVEQ